MATLNDASALTISAFLLRAIGCEPVQGRVTSPAGQGAGKSDKTNGDSEGCYLTRKAKETIGAETYQVSYVRYEYDRSSRLLAKHEVPEPTAGAKPTNTLYYRFDATGRKVGYGDKDGSMPFRGDLSFDDHGNVTRDAMVYEDWTDLAERPSASPYSYYAYVHSYDKGGLLTESSLTGLEPNVGLATKITYTHDAENRCATEARRSGAASEPVLTRFFYDDNKVSKIVDEFATDGGTSKGTTTYRYDAEGRLISEEQDGATRFAQQMDGVVDISARYSYEKEGSYTVERLDCTTDLPNEEIQSEGKVRACFRSFVTYCAGCEKLRAQLPKVASSLACRFRVNRRTTYGVEL